jgi:hypothetical protein
MGDELKRGQAARAENLQHAQAAWGAPLALDYTGPAAKFVRHTSPPADCKE